MDMENTDLSGLYRRYWLRSRVLLTGLIGLSLLVPSFFFAVGSVRWVVGILATSLVFVLSLVSVSEQLVFVTAKDTEQVRTDFSGEHNPLFWVHREMATRVQNTDGRMTCYTEHVLGDREVTYEATHTDTGLCIAVFRNDTQTMSLQVEATREDERTTVTVDATMETRLSLYRLLLSKVNEPVGNEAYERYGYQITTANTRLSVF